MFDCDTTTTQEQHTETTSAPDANPGRDASILAPRARAATFAALASVLEELVRKVNTDARLSPDARRVLRAMARTNPGNSLALADLAALDELETYGHLARLARIAQHLTAALPARTPVQPPGAVRTGSHNQGDS